MHATFRMLFVALITALRNEQVRIIHSCVKRGGPVVHTVSDGIMDRKLVIVAGNQADRLRRQITKLGYFVKAGSGYNSTGRDIATSSPHTGSHRTQHPACSRR